MAEAGARELIVRTPAGSYPVVVGEGALSALPALVGSPALVVSSHTVAPLHGERVAQQLGCPLVVVDDGEQHKRLATVERLYQAFVDHGVDRQTAIVAVGGGTIGDTVGHAAATYLRGVPLVQVPTTLLAMVDAAVGGKVGVNLPAGKNLVGAFYQPRAVLVDPTTLATLPGVQLRNGLAEVVKHGLLGDEQILDALERRGLAAVEQSLIARALRIKIDVVERDPHERDGLRERLNFGHTFGHAIEVADGYDRHHGEAVAIGITLALRLGCRRGITSPGLLARVVALLERLGLPTTHAGFDAGVLWDRVHTDKKRRQGRPRFILLRAIGEPLVVDDVERDEVAAVLAGADGGTSK